LIYSLYFGGLDDFFERIFRTPRQAEDRLTGESATFSGVFLGGWTVCDVPGYSGARVE
jgi:hypothetical protein